MNVAPSKDAPELLSLMGALGNPNMGNEEVAELLKQIDHDGDGVASLEEVLHALVRQGGHAEEL
eukprot:SAG31_NODE_4865_length_2899_cov_8.739286_3_plen_64_part_00